MAFGKRGRPPEDRPARQREIYMAVVSGLAAGTVALIPAGDGILELTKMAVSPAFQGMGIGSQVIGDILALLD